MNLFQKKHKLDLKMKQKQVLSEPVFCGKMGWTKKTNEEDMRYEVYKNAGNWK